MAHLTTANLQKVLDALVVTPHWRKAMATIRASEPLAFSWRAKSIKAQKDGDTSSEFFIEWRGTFDFWHCHAARARSENIILYEAAIRDQALNGIEEAVLGPDQRPLYRERPEYIGRDDDYVRQAEGLMDIEDVAWHRLEHDPKTGHPIPLTKHTQLAAPIKLRVLEQTPSYRETKVIDAQLQITTTAKPFERLPGEERPAMEKLKRLAAMTAEERRAELGASPPPVMAHRAPAGRPDHPPSTTQRPSYARPDQSLDRGESIGRGTAPDGGGPANAPGNIR
jgi:hypothetical protein